MKKILLAALIIFIPAPAQAWKFHDDRQAHQATIEQHQSKWNDDYTSNADVRAQNLQTRNDDRTAHQSNISQSKEDWETAWNNSSGVRKNKEDQRNNDRASHQSKIASQPEQWWKNYPTNE